MRAERGPVKEPLRTFDTKVCGPSGSGAMISPRMSDTAMISKASSTITPKTFKSQPRTSSRLRENESKAPTLSSTITGTITAHHVRSTRPGMISRTNPMPIAIPATMDASATDPILAPPRLSVAPIANIADGFYQGRLYEEVTDDRQHRRDYEGEDAVGRGSNRLEDGYRRKDDEGDDKKVSKVLLIEVKGLPDDAICGIHCSITPDMSLGCKDRRGIGA